MEDNVALDSSKQKQFVKSIKGIKKLIKKNDTKADDVIKEKTLNGKIRKKRRQRGLVYLSHIPHGFYEHEMTQYFKQFGVVTNVRVIRSKKTGNSKGFAFVEFKEPSVGQIVAETMNNYLMGKRLIKAAYVPPEKQKRAFRKHWDATNNPGAEFRTKMKKAHNKDRDEQGELQRARKLIANVNRNKKKLRELGIDYDFFTPVDIPETLRQVKQEKDENEQKQNSVMIMINKKNKNKVTEDVKNTVNTKKDKQSIADNADSNKTLKGKGNKVENQTAKQLQQQVKTKDNKRSKLDVQKVNNIKEDKTKKEVNKAKDGKNKNNVLLEVIKKKKDNSKQNHLLEVNKKNDNRSKPGKLQDVNKKNDKSKEKGDKNMKNKLEKINTKKIMAVQRKEAKGKGVKPLEEFVQIGQDSDSESGSSAVFDSDEFEKMMQNDDNDDVDTDLSDDESSEDGASEETDEEDD